MGVGSINKTDIFALNNIVQSSMLSYPKDLICETLKDQFSTDSYYRYVRDEFGFAKRLDLTDVPVEAGLHDNVTTRVYIGQAFNYDQRFYPAIIVRAQGFRSIPISFNRNEGVTYYRTIRVLDESGNEKIYSTPSYFGLAGAWEGTISIDVIAGDMRARDDLVEIIASIMTITNLKSMQHAGVTVKPISISAPSEVDDLQDKLYKQSVVCDVRCEWQQHIPIDSVMEAINFCIDFGDLSQNPAALAPNIEINSSIELAETIIDL